MAGHVDLKRFETPDEVRTFEKGRLALIRIGGMLLGRAEFHWVVGDRPYVSLHLMGADSYAR